MLLDREGLWYRVLRARYGDEGGCLREGGSESSIWWRMVVGIRKGVGLGLGSWFDDNVRRVIGGGDTTYFWTDNWVGDVPLRVRFPRLFALAVNKWTTVEGWVAWRGRCLDVEEAPASMEGGLCYRVLCFTG